MSFCSTNWPKFLEQKLALCRSFKCDHIYTDPCHELGHTLLAAPQV
jgi:hypothetical protein